MANLTLYQTCRFCRGTGLMPVVQEDGSTVDMPCIKCDETGKFVLGLIDIDDVMDAINDVGDKVNDVLGKCNDILEQVTS